MKRLQIHPWKPLFQHHISALNPPTFALATTSTTPATSPTNAGFSQQSPNTTGPQSITPRCRTLVYRGFLANIPPNKHNSLESHNPRRVYESDVLTFTTDSRMAKTGEILPTHASGGNAEAKTAGGAYVEAMFWIPSNSTTGEGIQNQWRLRGKCYLLAEEDVDDAPNVTAILHKHMLPTGAEGAEKWSWRKEVQSHFGNLTPALRGSFVNPPPGTSLDVPLSGMSSGKSGGGDVLTKGKRIENDSVLDQEGLAAIARRNMRVGVIVPEFVERLDLAEDDGKARRWVWSRVGEEDQDAVNGWKMEETWP